MINKQEFLRQVGDSMEGSHEVIEGMVQRLVQTIIEVDARNEGLADKLRASNEEAAGLRELRRSAQELAGAHRECMHRVIMPSPLVPHMNNLFAALAEAPPDQYRHMHHDLVWALERLAEQTDECDDRILRIADRFNFPVMIPVRIKVDELLVAMDFGFDEDVDVEPELESAFEIAFPDAEPDGMTAKNLEKLQDLSECLPDATFNELLLAGGLFSRLMPAMKGLPDEAQVGLAILPDGHASISVDLNDIPPDWTQDWIGVRPGR